MPSYFDGYNLLDKTAGKNIDQYDPAHLQKIADYFGVAKVASVHVEDCDTPAFWVVYKD